jgi:alpha-1,2-mannosyltransferase
LGQIQIWIAFTLAFIALLYKGELQAGAPVRLICLLKPQFDVFAVWAVLRRRWRFLLRGAITFSPRSFVSLSLFGFRTQIDNLRQVSFLSRRGQALIANNSANGILRR